jgi:ankyrin repeat protein
MAREKEKNIISDTNNDGYTPLRFAVEKKNFEAVKCLSQRYKDHGITPDEWSLLHLAYHTTHRTAFLSALIENGWNINELDGEGRTLLIIAAEKDDGVVMKFLLKNGANKEAKDNRGYTPLLVAVSCDNLEAVKVYLS